MPAILHADEATARFQVGFVLLNGASHEHYTDAVLASTAVHELGHLLGLDHSQLNEAHRYDGDPANDALAPIMSYGRGPNETPDLHLDDRAWFAWLYPGPAAPTATGSIRGRVLLPDGKAGLAGINVIARRVDDPQVTAVSGISGYLLGPGATPHPDRLGEFLLPGLPPGSYTVELQPLEYSPAVGIAPGFLSGGAKFWRDGSSAQDPPAAFTPIAVNAGAETGGIDIVMNGESLGEPRSVLAQEPNDLPFGQVITLPAVIAGELQGGAGPDAASSAGPNRHDVFRVTLREWTTVTAILTATNPAADLDLDLLRVDGPGFTVWAESTEVGTPPEVLQYRLPPGRWYFGVHRAGLQGSPYTLQLLATPTPELDEGLAATWISYVLLGDVTANSATLRWGTTTAVPSVVTYNLPRREIGSTGRTLDHTLPLADLPRDRRTVAAVYAASPGGADKVELPVKTARAPAPDGEPRLVVGSDYAVIDYDLVEVEVRLTNPGDGDALQVSIDRVGLPAGWKLLTDLYSGTGLPEHLEVGRIGAGGAAVLLLRLVRLRGDAEPRVTLRGSYTDTADRQRRF